MNYEDRIVCFLDILGFKSHISSSVSQDGSDVTDKIDDLADAFNSIRDILDIDRPEERPGTEITQFSDSIVISFPVDTESGVFLRYCTSCGFKSTSCAEEYFAEAE